MQSRPLSERSSQPLDGRIIKIIIIEGYVVDLFGPDFTLSAYYDDDSKIKQIFLDITINFNHGNYLERDLLSLRRLRWIK